MICYEDSRVTLYQGDALPTLLAMPDESVHCVVTSPPYWGLRDYHVEGQLGLERTPEEYVAKMVEVFREVRRVLRKGGTLWLNMGDSYNANAGRGFNGQKRQDDASRHTVMPLPVGLKPKDLIGLPWMLAFALRADGWYLRSDIIWSKPNPMPESVTDRPTKAHEYLFLLAKSARYYYDADAIRTALRPKTLTTFGTTSKMRGHGDELVKAENWAHDVPVRRPRLALGPDAKNANKPEQDGHRRLAEHVKAARAAGADHDNPFARKDKQRGHGRRHVGFNDRWDLMSREEQQVAGANARDVWEIATQGYPEAHFATFPEALVKPCILAGCPVDGIVLDPFVGSGTTILVAKNLNRRAIGIELSPDYCALIPRRLQQGVLPL